MSFRYYLLFNLYLIRIIVATLINATLNLLIDGVDVVTFLKNVIQYGGFRIYRSPQALTSSHAERSQTI